MKKRFIDTVVISDIHLGTYGCHAKELNQYLKSIQPKTVVLNGDIIDIWQFKKKYWPKSHMKIIKHIMRWISKGTKVYYVTGNHNEMLRKFTGFKLGSFEIVDKILLTIDGKKAWCFHGDIFDVTMQHSKWLAKLGAVGYDTLILINRGINLLLTSFKREPISISKKIKNSVKSAVKFINDFEKIATEIAIDNNYDYVICGHIHQPEIKKTTTKKGTVTYLNSGDWIENLTALEYNNGSWSLYEYQKDSSLKKTKNLEEDVLEKIPETKELFENLLLEFHSLPSNK